MEYTLGVMSARVKSRFERLMADHPYIAASVAEQQYKLGHLVEHLPGQQPPERVWAAIESALDERDDAHQTSAQSESKGPAWWNFLNMKLVGVAFSLLLAVFVAVPLMQQNKAEPTVISSMLMSESEEAMLEVVATKDDMMMEVKVMHDIEVPEGMRLALWCLPKGQDEKPMNMGTVAVSGMTEMPIDKSTWRGMKEAGSFAVSVEPMDTAVGNSMGRVLYKGPIQLAALH